MTKVEFLEIWTGSENFDIGVRFRFRKLEYVRKVEKDLCAKLGVNQTWFVWFRHRLSNLEVSNSLSLNRRMIFYFSVV